MQTAKEVLKQFEIWLNWTLKLGGLLLIYHCISLKFDLYTPFRAVELAEVWDKQNDAAYAIMALQEDVLELHKKAKK